MKGEWTVRVVQTGQYEDARQIGSVELPGLWVEQLRHMGLVNVLQGAGDRELEVLEFIAPAPDSGRKTLGYTKVWAEQESERMKSFGINAVAAPKWER